MFKDTPVKYKNSIEAVKDIRSKAYEASANVIAHDEKSVTLSFNTIGVLEAKQIVEAIMNLGVQEYLRKQANENGLEVIQY